MVKIKNYTVSLLIAFVVAAIFLCVSAAIFTYTNINDRHLQTFVFGTVFISNLVGATLLSRKVKEKGLIYGALFGFIYCLLIYLITALAFTGFVFTNTLGIYVAVCIVSGMVGGIIGVNL